MSTQPLARTAPPPPPGPPTVRFRRGARVTDLIDMPDGRRRLVGDVIDSNCWLFSVRWTGGEGVARYAHSHEPATLRHATAADEQAAVTPHERAAAAHELLRVVAAHPHWPAQVRHALTARAAQLAEKPTS